MNVQNLYGNCSKAAQYARIPFVRVGLVTPDCRKTKIVKYCYQVFFTQPSAVSTSASVGKSAPRRVQVMAAACNAN